MLYVIRLKQNDGFYIGYFFTELPIANINSSSYTVYIYIYIYIYREREREREYKTQR